MNKIALTTLALALAAQAHAGLTPVQNISLPGAMPIAPVIAPAALPGNTISLPSISVNNQPKWLPSAPGMPKIAPSLPNLPKPLITIPGQPTNKLPGVKLPVVSREQVVTVKGFAAFASFEPAKTGSDVKDADKTRESLGRAFDGSAQEEVPSEVRHTLPETDLLNEIGIQ